MILFPCAQFHSLLSKPTKKLHWILPKTQKKITERKHYEAIWNEDTLVQEKQKWAKAKTPRNLLINKSGEKKKVLNATKKEK